MNNNTSNPYEIEFFTSARLSEFWDMIAGLLKFASIPVLIFVAISGVGLLITAIIFAFKKGADPEETDRDYDIKYYD